MGVGVGTWRALGCNPVWTMPRELSVGGLRPAEYQPAGRGPHGVLARVIGSVGDVPNGPVGVADANR
jgi:hypothetical protein